MLKKVLHTGLAVPDLVSAIEMYEALGFTATKQFHKPDIDADVVLVTNEETVFELFEFHDPDQPQVAFIRNHVAIYSDAIEADVQALIAKGYRLTIPITDGVTLRFAYVQDKTGMNYEIATEKT